MFHVIEVVSERFNVAVFASCKAVFVFVACDLCVNVDAVAVFRKIIVEREGYSEERVVVAVVVALYFSIGVLFANIHFFESAGDVDNGGMLVGLFVACVLSVRVVLSVSV